MFCLSFWFDLRIGFCLFLFFGLVCGIVFFDWFVLWLGNQVWFGFCVLEVVWNQNQGFAGLLTRVHFLRFGPKNLGVLCSIPVVRAKNPGVRESKCYR